MRLFRLLLLAISLPFVCKAQVKEFGLKLPDPKSSSKVCREIMATIRSMPADVTMGLYEKDGAIYWGITDDTWLARVFKDKKDGVAVDVISKSQFLCGQKNVLAGSKIYKGELLKPVLIKDVKNHILTDNEGMAGFKVGVLPEQYKGTDYELNMLLIHDGNVCSYNSFFDVPRIRWDILKMPMFYDSVKTVNPEKHVVITSEMKLIIPFEKNKYDYTEETIRPLYDSLKLKDYTITGIEIKAFSSVEGPTDNNLRLQNNRAEAIAEALEKVQNSVAIKKIGAEENWVEFFNDVDSLKFPKVHHLSKPEIKKRLEDQKLASIHEPMLARHRKAIVTLTLERKGSYMNVDAGTLVKDFQKSINSKDIETGIRIQEAVRERVNKGEFKTDLLEETEIPREIAFVSMLNNRSAFKKDEDSLQLRSKIAEFEDLKSKFPDNASILYNLAVLKIKTWAGGDSLDPARLRLEIKDLSTRKIDQFLIKRLYINYHIILSELLINQRKYEAKDQALKFIYDNYRSLYLKDEDLLQLAKYFSGYSRLDWAEKILLTRIKSPEAHEDLVFYYLNLTIIEPKNLKKSSYRSIVTSASAKDPKRFCRMFDPYGRGGINFQLLADDFLKKQYCDVCK